VKRGRHHQIASATQIASAEAGFSRNFQTSGENVAFQSLNPGTGTVGFTGWSPATRTGSEGPEWVHPVYEVEAGNRVRGVARTPLCLRFFFGAT
jgi:hypothetical protein